MNTKYLVYTFAVTDNLTYKLLRRLKHKDTSKFYINGQKGVERLIKHILKNNYQYILGLGDFRKDARRIRIEARFINKYGKSKILENGPEYYNAGWELPLFEDMYISDKASSGPCNRSAYLIARAISENNLNTKLAFLHIPRSYNLKKAHDKIKQLIL